MCVCVCMDRQRVLKALGWHEPNQINSSTTVFLHVPTCWTAVVWQALEEEFHCAR